MMVSDAAHRLQTVDCVADGMAAPEEANNDEGRGVREATRGSG